MTKRKKAGKNEKEQRVNQTAHQQAMANPQAQKALSVLRDDWNGLSPEQLGERLNELIGLGCSARGIAKELGKPETSIRRYIALANQPEPGSDWITMLERTLATGFPTQSAKNTREAADCKPSRIPTKKGARPIVKETSSVKDHVQSSRTPQAKKVATPPSTRAQERPILDRVASEKQSQPGVGEPGMSPLELYKLSKGQSLEDRMRRLAAISDSIKPRPFRNAHSMQRQGRPLPPKDDL